MYFFYLHSQIRIEKQTYESGEMLVESGGIHKSVAARMLWLSQNMASHCRNASGRVNINIWSAYILHHLHCEGVLYIHSEAEKKTEKFWKEYNSNGDLKFAHGECNRVNVTWILASMTVNKDWLVFYLVDIFTFCLFSYSVTWKYALLVQKILYINVVLSS